MLAHVLGQHAHANAGEIIDREPGVSRVFRREKALEARTQNLISEAGLQTGQAKILCQILEQDLDENSATGRGLLFIDMDNRQDMPSDGVIAEHVPEEPGDVAQTICFIAVDGVVVLGECGLVQI